MNHNVKIPLILPQKNIFVINILNSKKNPLLKKKIKGLQNSTGRNHSGKIVVSHKGGGHKKKYRKINFYRSMTSTGIVSSIEYDPNRNTNIASVYNFSNKTFFYILAPRDLGIGDILKSSQVTEPKLGYSLPLRQIPVGSYIYNISLKSFHSGQVSRSAGTFSKLKEKTLNHVVIKLSSGKFRAISSQCYATLGIVSNELVFLLGLKKAGQSRWLNIRPTVRGVAMNPIDHPHGGGEGKKSGIKKTP